MKEIAYEKPEFEKEEDAWQKKKKAQLTAPTVRTFRADVQDLIKEKGVTRNEIGLAEAARREARGETRFPVQGDGPHLGRIISILLLVLAFGIGVGGYALFGTHLNSLLGGKATSTPPTPTVDELKVDITSSPREQILADISIAFGKTYLPTGGSRSIVFLIKREGGDVESATMGEFFTATLPRSIPKPLADSLSSQFTYRVYASSTLSGVIGLSSRSYPNTLSAMLDWEAEMAAALIPVLDPFRNRKSILELRDRPFRDETWMGVNIRTLRDLDGVPVVAYGFLDKKTLLISGSTDALHAMIAAASVQK